MASAQEVATSHQPRRFRPFPQAPFEQLELAIKAVFRSWNAPRAIRYRQIQEITGLKGTAVNIQAMVFGNMGEDCGTGVAFTRDPSTGKNVFYGEFLINAQGEDVVAGIRTPLPIDQLTDYLPDCYKQLLVISDILEKHYKDIQDFEFTIQNETLYMLQTRAGKRTGLAAVRIAVEMVKERMIDKKTAILRVDPAALDQLLHPQFDPKAPKKIIATGLAASPGAASGKIAFTAEDADIRAELGEQVMLGGTETAPADIGGMNAPVGTRLSTGGMTRHAASGDRGDGWGYGDTAVCLHPRRLPPGLAGSPSWPGSSSYFQASESAKRARKSALLVACPE